MKPDYIKECRLCKSSNISDILKLKDSPLCDVYGKEAKSQKFYPLGLTKCSDCDFVQLSYLVPPELIYLDYLYVTSSSMGLKEHFKSYSENVIQTLKLNNNKIVLDIGSNDGTLLNEFKKFGLDVVGVEPAKEIADEATNNGILTYPNFFDNNLVDKIILNHGKVDLITINNLFANIVNLNEFLENILSVLSPSGVIIIESSYLFDMIKNNVFDFIYHEHLSYFSLKPLQKWFSKYGLEIFNIEKISTKGGSLRYYISRKGSYKTSKNVPELMTQEIQGKKLQNLFKQFEQEIQKNKNDLHSLIKKYKNKCIIAYGASATSTTLITHYELSQYIDYFVDDNPSKINTYSPGYNIKVKSKEFLSQKKPDLVIIFAWRYVENIFDKLKGIKTDIIVPLPKPQYIRKI